MRIVYLLIGLAFLALSGFVMVTAFDLEYYTDLGPGPGFFPFWLAAVLAAVNVAWLIQVYIKPASPRPEGFIPKMGPALRLVSVLVAMMLFVMVGEYLGFRLTNFVFLVFLMVILGNRSVPVIIAVALLGSFGTYYLFHDVMGVHLPIVTVEFLKNLGL